MIADLIINLNGTHLHIEGVDTLAEFALTCAIPFAVMFVLTAGLITLISRR